MNILYCGDSNVSDGLMISVLSLIKHTDEPLNIYALTMNLEFGHKVYKPLDSELGEYLQKLLKEKNSDSTFEIIDVTDNYKRELPKLNLATRFTPACMLRLYADLQSNLPSKLLYLDTDVICRGDFSDFYNEDMDGIEVSGVLDHYGKWFFRRNPFKFDYLNSGVLMLNLELIRKTGLFTRCRKRCIEKQMFMPDQSAINKLAKSKKYNPRRYNEQRKLRKNTVFHHFTTSFRLFPYFHSVTVKPWQINEVHNVLKIYEYDTLFEEFAEHKKKYIELKKEKNI